MSADTVSVRQLFADSIEIYRNKYKLVSTARIYKKCAIVIADEDMAEIAQWLQGDSKYFLQAYLESDAVLHKGLHTPSRDKLKRFLHPQRQRRSDSDVPAI